MIQQKMCCLIKFFMVHFHLLDGLRLQLIMGWLVLFYSDTLFNYGVGVKELKVLSYSEFLSDHLNMVDDHKGAWTIDDLTQ